jgi:hypothetical protein
MRELHSCSCQLMLALGSRASSVATYCVLDVRQVAAYRRSLEICVGGLEVPKPVKEFDQCGFDAQLMGAIKKAGCVSACMHAQLATVTSIIERAQTQVRGWMGGWRGKG